MHTHTHTQCRFSTEQGQKGVLKLLQAVGVEYTAIPIIIEGQFQAFQRFSSSKLVLKTVESCFAALNYYGNGSRYSFRF